MKRLAALLVAVAAFAAVAYIATGGLGPRATPSPSTAGTPVTATDEVVADGRVVPRTRAELGPAIPGTVAEVLVEAGDDVRAGDEMLRLADAAPVAAVEGAEASLTAAEANVARAEAQRDALPDDAPDEQVRATDADVDAAIAQQQSAAAALRGAQAALAETVVTSPIDGTVIAVDVEAGDAVAPGTPVVRVGDLSGWSVITTDLDELNAVRVREGDTAVVRVDALPGAAFEGHVESVGRYGRDEQGDVLYEVEVFLDGDDEALRWNLTAEVAVTPAAD
jgi:HlyD family secretion protein